MEKVPALDAKMMNEVFLPWIEEHWREAVKLHNGRTGEGLLGSRGYAI